jgi:hypothetical protein
MRAGTRAVLINEMISPIGFNRPKVVNLEGVANTPHFVRSFRLARESLVLLAETASETAPKLQRFGL